MISPLLIDKFEELFRGNKKAYGKYIIENEKGEKVSGQAYTEIGIVKKEFYQNHLEGKTGLGIIPINKESKCKFGTIDIDEYNIDHKKLLERIKSNSLPLILFRSKSGGAHLFVFLKSWADAGSVQDALSFFSIILGYKKLEIFPKQRKMDKNKVGNWINLPYFNNEKTNRFAYDDNGNKLDLFEAIKYIENRTIDILELEKIVEDFPYKDAPPCLQYLLNGVIEKGERNNFLFNVAIYFKQREPDTWQEDLMEVNKKLKEALTLDELTKSIIGSLNKKEYFYACRNEPLVSVCDKVLCRQRKFGIESDSIPSEIIGSLVKIDFLNEPLWDLNVNGVNITFTTIELMNHNIYQRKCFESLHSWPKALKKEAWRKIIEERLDKVEIQKGPEGAGHDGLFKRHLMEFCTERAEAATKNQILNKRVFTEKGFHYFKLDDFMDYLKFVNFTFYSTPIAWKRLRDLGGTPIQLRIDSHQKIRAWRIEIIKNPKLEKEIKPVDFEHYDEAPY